MNTKDTASVEYQQSIGREQIKGWLNLTTSKFDGCLSSTTSKLDITAIKANLIYIIFSTRDTASVDYQHSIYERSILKNG